MQIKPIRTENEYNEALLRVEPYFDNQPKVGTPEADLFEILVMLIETYEAKHYPIAPPDPIEAIKFRMEQGGLSIKDLVPLIGRATQVDAILARRRPLTLPMIRRLHATLGIPAESLIGETVRS